MAPSAVSMVLHPFCSHIICELPPLVEAHQQLPIRRLAVDVVIILYVLQCTCYWTVLHSIHRCSQNIRMHVHKRIHMGSQGKWKARNNKYGAKKERKTRQIERKWEYMARGKKEHSFHGNREGCLWNWQPVNTHHYKYTHLFLSLRGMLHWFTLTPLRHTLTLTITHTLTIIHT